MFLYFTCLLRAIVGNDSRIESIDIDKLQKILMPSNLHSSMNELEMTPQNLVHRSLLQSYLMPTESLSTAS
jgi:hypothetical protein